MFVCMVNTCALCTYLMLPEENIGFPGTGFKDNGAPMWVLGTGPGSSARAPPSIFSRLERTRVSEVLSLISLTKLELGRFYSRL